MSSSLQEYVVDFKNEKNTNYYEKNTSKFEELVSKMIEKIEEHLINYNG